MGSSQTSEATLPVDLENGRQQIGKQREEVNGGANEIEKKDFLKEIEFNNCELQKKRNCDESEKVNKAEKKRESVVKKEKLLPPLVSESKSIGDTKLQSTPGLLSKENSHPNSSEPQELSSNKFSQQSLKTCRSELLLQEVEEEEIEVHKEGEDKTRGRVQLRSKKFRPQRVV